MDSDLRKIEYDIRKLRLQQDENLEKAYRKDERSKTIKEILHEMVMFEHRKDLDTQGKWDELKERLESFAKVT